MFTRLFNPAVLAIAVMLAQWVGMVHRIEHHTLLEQTVRHHSSTNILHDCLLFDALSTAHAPTCQENRPFYAPQQLVIGHTQALENTLPSQNAQNRVRVRDPPQLS